jgi:hypothetical protein
MILPGEPEAPLPSKNENPGDYGARRVASVPGPESRCLSKIQI